MVISDMVSTAIEPDILEVIKDLVKDQKQFKDSVQFFDLEVSKDGHYLEKIRQTNPQSNEKITLLMHRPIPILKNRRLIAIKKGRRCALMTHKEFLLNLIELYE